MKVIFLLDLDYGPWARKRLGTDAFLKLGIAVEIWEIRSLIIPHSADRPSGEERVIDNLLIRSVRSFRRLRQLCRSCAGASLALMYPGLFPLGIHQAKLYRTVCDAKIPYAIIGVGGVPVGVPPTPDRTWLDRFRSRVWRAWLSSSTDPMLMRLARKGFEMVPISWYGVYAAAFAFVGGTTPILTSYPIDQGTKRVPIHTYDYDSFLQLSREAQGQTEKSPYGLFIDEYWPFHKDFELLGWVNPTRAEVYYPEICRWMDAWEKRNGIPMKIAVHPTSRYEEHGNLYGGRELIKFKTAELVRDALLVVTTNSTAISYPILWRKPIILLMADAFKGTRFETTLEFFAQWLKVQTQNVSGNPPPLSIEECPVDSDAYERFQSTYIKAPGTPQIPFWEIIAQETFAFLSSGRSPSSP